jgi:hypothetical protein
MLRILYEDIKNTETVDEISSHNMIVSDVYLNKETLIHASYGWIISNNNRNFQDLEKYFRLNNFNTYLIAKKVISDKTFVLKTPNNNITELLYECYFSCKPREMSLQELLDNYSSYDENYENLAKAGNLCIDTHELDNDEKKDMDDNILIKKLMSNKIKLIFKKLTPEESISQMSEDILKTTGNKPIITIIGKLNEDVPIMAFLLSDGNVASNIAWSIKKENNETVYQLIDLNEYYAKNKKV